MKYKCPYCGKLLSHQQAWVHAQYTCPKRPGAERGKG